MFLFRKVICCSLYDRKTCFVVCKKKIFVSPKFHAIFQRKKDKIKIARPHHFADLWSTETYKTFYVPSMRRSNCSAPIPPRGHHSFGGCPGLLSLYFYLTLPSLITLIPSFLSASSFQCPALFYHTHSSSDPGAAPGKGGGI